MGRMILLAAVVAMINMPGYCSAASEKCTVVKQEGNTLVMKCGDRANQFPEKTKVKIKTDRGKR